MKIRVKNGSKLALAVGVLVVAATAASSLAFPPKAGCPRRGIYCLDVWQPVICSNGQVYSNSCYAYVACATGCVPYGGETE